MSRHFGSFRMMPWLIAAFVFSGAACAQMFPAKVVRVVVPFPPGTGVDAVTRFFAVRLSEMTGQQFIVDNRGGAASNIGTEAVARAPADGYTLLAPSASIATNASLYKNLRFDPVRDFEPIAILASAPFMLAVHPSIPAKSVAELIAIAKARPGQLMYASAGNGSVAHLTTELFKMLSGAALLQVPYQGGSQGVVDLISGEVSMMFSTISVLQPAVKAGRLRALAVTSARRSSLVPDLPTVAEAGLPGFESDTWFALFAPARTAREIVARLNAAIVKIGRTPEATAMLKSQGAEHVPATPEEVVAFVRSEVGKWGKVVAASGLRLD